MWLAEASSAGLPFLGSHSHFIVTHRGRPIFAVADGFAPPTVSIALSGLRGTSGETAFCSVGRRQLGCCPELGRNRLGSLRLLNSARRSTFHFVLWFPKRRVARSCHCGFLIPTEQFGVGSVGSVETAAARHCDSRTRPFVHPQMTGGRNFRCDRRHRRGVLLTMVPLVAPRSRGATTSDHWGHGPGRYSVFDESWHVRLTCIGIEICVVHPCRGSPTRCNGFHSTSPCTD
jgi:hypothetical protein